MSRAELIVVRSLTDSDLGLFAAHRSTTSSNQRAIALTTQVAEELLHPSIIAAKSGDFDCICLYGPVINRELRMINKADKNWRLGGRKLEHKAFGNLDSKDFALIRSVRHNDGSSPVLLTFIGRRSQPIVQAGLGATFERSLQKSVAIFDETSEEFEALADLFPPVPAKLAVQPVVQQQALL